MRLLQFSCEKFRSIKESIVLPLHKISIFIGQNGGGKTATLEALNLLLNPKDQFKDSDLNSNINKSDALEIIFKGKFNINEKEREFFKNYNNSIVDTLELNRKFNLNDGNSYYFIYSLGTNTDLDNLELGRYKAPYQDLCQKWEIENYDNLNVNQMQERLLEKRNELACDKKIEKIIPNNEIEKFLPKFIFFSSEEDMDPKNKITQILKDTLKLALPTLKFDNEIDRITKGIIDICKKKIDEAINSIKKYCKDIKTIEIVPEYNVLGGLTLNNFNIIKEGEIHVKFESEATGKRKQIMLGLYEWSNLQITEDIENNFILAFDEPDLHFDYIQISNLLKILRDFSNKNNIQVIVATHSIKLIDNFPPNQIIHFRLSTENTTQLEYLTESFYQEISEYLKEISLSIGFRSAFLFFEKTFVVIEGESEYKAFPLLFEIINKKTPIEAGISFINAQDNEQALKFGKYLKEKKKNVIVIVDKDSEKKKNFRESDLRKMGFIKNSDLFFVGEDKDKGELESEFSSKQWIDMLNILHPKLDKNKWIIKEIDEIRKDGKFSEKLSKLIEGNCKEIISKPKLIYNLVKSIKNEDELSDNLRKVFGKLNSIT